MRRRYFLLRHGRSEANDAGMIASRLSPAQPDAGLTEEGRHQVRRSAIRFRREFASQAIEIVASPFRRAVETAEIAADVLDCGFTRDGRLKERDFGALEGLSDDHYHIVWDADRRGEASDAYLVEPIESVISRLSNLIEELEASDSDAAVLLCSHGDIISIALTYFAGRDPRLHRDYGALANAEVRELLFDRS